MILLAALKLSDRQLNLLACRLYVQMTAAFNRMSEAP